MSPPLCKILHNFWATFVAKRNFFWSNFWATFWEITGNFRASCGKPLVRASARTSAKCEKQKYFLLPNHYPLALAVTKSPTVLYFISRARRTLKRKKRVCEQAIWIAPFLYARFEILVDVSCRNEAWEELVCGSLSVFFTPGGWHESGVEVHLLEIKVSMTSF